MQGIDSAAMPRSLPTMFNYRRILAIALLVLWGPVTLHCGMEVDGMFGSAPILAAKAANPHAPVAPDTDPDGCGAIETGRFESLLVWLTVPAPDETGCVVWLELSEPDLSVVPLPSSESSARCIEWVPRWAFHRRAAHPPRAPCFIS